MNVAETANIQDPNIRTAKLRLLREVAGSVNPYQAPNDLLADIAQAYDSRTGSITLGDHTSWFAIHNPQEIDDALAAEGLKWHADRERWFRKFYEDLRPSYQRLFESGAAPRPRSAAALLKYFIERRETYYDSLLLPIYERQTGNKPSHEEFSKFLDDPNVRGWALFWLARVYAAYVRAVQHHRFGWKVNAGLHDLDSAIYLPFCDWFVTGDVPQRRAFRLLNVRNPRGTRIVDYAKFRSQLLIG